MELSHVLGALAVVLSVLYAWPQALRSLRASHIEGISKWTTLLIFFTTLSWALYGSLRADLAIVLANSAGAAAVGLTAIVLYRRKVLRARDAAFVTLTWTLVILGALGLWGAAGAGIVGTALGASMTLPQAWRAYRTGDTSGVSATSYSLLLALVTTWLVYGIVVGDFIIIAPNIPAIPSISAILVRLALDRRSSRPPPSTSVTANEKRASA